MNPPFCITGHPEEGTHFWLEAGIARVDCCNFNSDSYRVVELLQS
jgi:hypothetical protein